MRFKLFVRTDVLNLANPQIKKINKKNGTHLLSLLLLDLLAALLWRRRRLRLDLDLVLLAALLGRRLEVLLLFLVVVLLLDLLLLVGLGLDVLLLLLKPSCDQMLSM